MTQLTPEQVVERQLEAYNAHDLEAFMATYSPNIQAFKLSDGKPIYASLEEFRKDFESYFTEAPPHVEIGKRIVRGAYVIDLEFGSDPERLSWEAVAIYEVIDGLIQRVWFV